MLSEQKGRELNPNCKVPKGSMHPIRETCDVHLNFRVVTLTRLPTGRTES